MARYVARIDSPRPPAEVWDYVADFAHAPEWDPATIEASRLDDGPPRPGSRFHLVVRFLGRQLPVDYRIVAADRPREVVLAAERGRTRIHDAITIEEVAGGSRLTYDADLRITGVLGRLAEPLLHVAFRRMGAGAADGLRRELS